MSYMKAEFDGILKKYGHNVYLQRAIIGTGHDDTSYADKFEIHTVRYTPGGGLHTMTIEDEGGRTSYDRIYYFRSEANPWSYDRIYEDDPRVEQTVWIIEATIAMRGLNGEIEYFKAGASRIRPA